MLTDNMFQQLTEEDIKRMVEEEYYRLANKFRLSEVKNQSYSNKIKYALCQQKNVLDILKNEQLELKTNVQASKSKTYETKEEYRLSDIYVSIEQEKQLDDLISNEKAQITDLKAEIDTVKKEIIQFNKTDVQETKITEGIFKSEQRIRDLEDKLQVTTTRFNNMLTQNSEYRKQIESLLNERKNFFKKYMHLYKQLLQGKQIMLDLVEQASSTYDQREEAIKKLGSLKEKTKAEKRIQSKDVQDLKRKLDIAEDLYEFLSTKGQKRMLADLEAREATEKKRQREEMEDKINKYTKLLNKIRNLSDEQNINKFIARFQKSEEENMGFFNFVNGVNAEVEVLQVQITTLLDRIDEQREMNNKEAKDQQELLECLKNKLQERINTRDNLAKQVQASEALLNDLLINIERMFQEFECDTMPILALLGDNAHVNIFNVITCLKLLEKQLYEFIYVTYAKEKFVPPEDLIQGPIVQGDLHMIACNRPLVYHLASTSPCPLCVETDRIFVLDENNEADTLEEEENLYSQILGKVLAENTELEEELHNISSCRLPRSRAIMQARFQEQE